MSKSKSPVVSAAVYDQVANDAKKAAENKPNRKVAVAKSTKARTPREDSKASKARAVMAEYIATHDELIRKDVIALFVAECGLSVAGAATYFQNLRTEAGL